MRTTLNISDDVHRTLRQLSLDCKRTVTELICQAIEQVYLKPRGEATPKPFAQLEGLWKGRSHSQKELNELKSLWTPREVTR